MTALEGLHMADWKAEVTSLLEQMNKLGTVSLRTLADLVRSQDTCVQELEKTQKKQWRKPTTGSGGRYWRVPPYQHWKPDNKNYRQWIERFKNALDQARPGGARVLTYLAQLKDKDVLEATVRLEAQGKLGVTPEITIRTMLHEKQQGLDTYEARFEDMDETM